MTKRKSAKRALLLSAVSLLLCVSMFVGTTYAWFTDSVTSANNKIVAGNLDIELHLWNGTSYEDISETSAPIFGVGSVAQNNNAETLWEPGKTQVAYLKIVNKGTLALRYSVGLDVENVSKNLYEVMQYAITPDAKDGTGVDAWTAGNSVIVGTQTVANNVTMEPGAEHYFALSVHMDESAGNQYQDGEVNFDLTVLATQVPFEEDSFNDQYDADAEFATNVSNAAQFLAALSKGESVVLSNDIDLTGITWTPAGATLETAYSGMIDGQGHKIIGLSNAGSQSGAFGLIAYGTGNVAVKNIVFEDVNIQNGDEYSAAVMGLYIIDTDDAAATYSVEFENITVNGAINSSDKAAAILGCNYRSSTYKNNKNITFTFNNCVNNATISGASRNGGIAGAVSGEFITDGNNSVIKVIFNNCVNNGSVSSTSSTYKTGAIVGFASGDMNYEFNNCQNTGSADGDLLGRIHASMVVYSPTPSSSETFRYLDFVPQTLTAYDMGRVNTLVCVTYRWNTAVQTNMYDTGNYYVGNVLADDEWRITIDGKHYRLPFNVPVDGITDAGVVEDTVHNMNPKNVVEHWTNDEYECVQNGYVGSNGIIYYTFHKSTDGK